MNQTLTAGFQLIGPPQREGLVRAEFSPEGELVSLELLDVDGSISQEEQQEVLEKIKILFSKVGKSLLEQQALEAAEEGPPPSETSH